MLFVTSKNYCINGKKHNPDLESCATPFLLLVLSSVKLSRAMALFLPQTFAA